MGEVKGNPPQLSTFAALPAALRTAARDELALGLVQGQELARHTRQRVLAWAEENPGTFLLVGLGVGVVLGRLLFSPPRVRVELED